jgi:hypothetical protein
MNDIPVFSTDYLKAVREKRQAAKAFYEKECTVNNIPVFSAEFMISSREQRQAARAIRAARQISEQLQMQMLNRDQKYLPDEIGSEQPHPSVEPIAKPAQADEHESRHLVP